MANLPRESIWRDGIYQLDVNDDVRGGPLEEGGISNLQAKQLGDCTLFLKDKIETETEELNGRIETIIGSGGLLTAHDFGTANPTQQQLTDYALAQIGVSDPAAIWHKTQVRNTNNGHVWVLMNQPENEPPIFEWIDDGLDRVSIATEQTLGVVKGSSEFGKVSVEQDGSMKVNGIDEVTSASNGDQVIGLGRNLLELFGVSTIPEVFAELRRLCNNNGEIDNTGIPHFNSLQIGDYIDGLDFAGTAAPAGGTAPQAWNATYLNNRIEISGFNTYKGIGSTENIKNHILFTFTNIIAKIRMNATDIITGGYLQSEARTWLEGANGDGTGAFAVKLKQQMGGDYLYKVSRIFPKESGGYDWGSTAIFIPTELDVFGIPLWGSEGPYESGKRSAYTTPLQFPIHARSQARRAKRWNGSRDWWWLSSPYYGSSSAFTNVSGNGGSTNYFYASAVGGCAPAFCVA